MHALSSCIGKYIGIGKHQLSSMEKAKQIACDFIDKCADDLHQLSRSIWENPELAYKEHHAHDVITKFLEKHDFPVEKHYKLDTAFRAEFSTSDPKNKPRVAVICEYDALPGIGHACGHNLIAEIGVAAGIAIKHAMTSCGETLTGQVTRNLFLSCFKAVSCDKDF